MLLDASAISNLHGKALPMAAPAAKRAPLPGPGGDGYAQPQCVAEESTFRVQATEGL